MLVYTDLDKFFAALWSFFIELYFCRKEVKKWTQTAVVACVVKSAVKSTVRKLSIGKNTIIINKN